MTLIDGHCLKLADWFVHNNFSSTYARMSDGSPARSSRQGYGQITTRNSGFGIMQTFKVLSVPGIGNTRQVCFLEVI